MDYTIADRLAELRRTHGYSQESLAAELGLTRQAVSRWERGESLPDTENLIALANLYGVTLDELVRPEAADQGATPAEEGVANVEALVAGEDVPEGPPAADEASPEAQTEPGVEKTASVASDSEPAPAKPEPSVAPESRASSAPPMPEAMPAEASSFGLSSYQGGPAQPTEPPAKPHDGCLTKVLLGLLIAAVALALLVVGGCVLFTSQPASGPVEEHAAEVATEERAAGAATQEHAESSTNEVFVDVGQVESLDIDWAAGPVNVVVMDDVDEDGLGVIVTEEYLDEESARVPMRVDVEHGELSVSYAEAGTFGLHIDKGKALTVRLPQSLATSLRSVECDLASGSLEMGGLVCQTLGLELASGTMDVTDVVADKLDVDVASGKAKVAGTFAQLVEMDVASGELRVTSDVVPGDTDIDVASGNAVLELPAGSSFKAAVDKDSGTFQMDFEATRQGDVYTVGKGGNVVRVDIASGSVRIRER
ncbi:MAG: helix-turn-helix domain-containing protein [Atopobiaceae bacterium]|nr:helix-turn-helix domain-containing protein [Atopobiaceae bacterium]